MEMDLNGQSVAATTPAQVDAALARANTLPAFELWATAPTGATLCMLRNGVHAWLMYIPVEGDAGVRSCGDATRIGSADYVLGNGQVDTYPLSWCVAVEQCFSAVSTFLHSGGDRPEGIVWLAS